MEQMPILPIYTYTSKHLIHPSVNGMPPNLMDSANFKYVSLDQDSPNRRRATRACGALSACACCKQSRCCWW